MRLSFVKGQRLRVSGYKRGISLVEVVIGTALILLSLVGLTGAYSFYLRAGLRNTDTLKAAFLLEEGVEAAVLLRDSAWSNLSSLSPNTPYHLFWTGSSFVTTTTVQIIDGTFTRTVALYPVYRRDSDKDIVASTSPESKAIDAGIKEVVVSVTGPNGLSKELRTHLANLFE
ncbi:MAG: hypothetical protein Q7R88_01670 [bacterium]|nr:hypothetical protein [bacterium]